MAASPTLEHDRQQTQRRRRPPSCTRPRPSCGSTNRRRTTRRCSRSASLFLLVAVCLCCWHGRTPAAVASAAAAPGSPLTLRVRMPDGAVKRVKATTTDTVDTILGKLGMGGGGGEGLSTDGATGSAMAEGSASVAALGLGNGDFLYVKSDSAARAAAKAKLDALERMKVAAAAAGTRAGSGSTFVPFPEHARPPPPRATKRMKTWQDIEAMQAQTFSLKPQKDSNVKKISVEQSAMDDFVGYLKRTGLGKHRCALLFGRVSPATGGIKVEAMYEPPQKQPQRQRGTTTTATTSSGSSITYDSSALLEAARIAVAAATTEGGGEGNASSGVCETGGDAAAAEVGRAVRVAGLLGLRLVGWCLSHDKREHYMAASDVVTASALQLMSMAEKSKEEGILVATVTLPVNVTDGEVATEAFSVSNQTVQMFSEGVLAQDQPDPTADKVKTTSVVKEGGKETTTPETLGLICNVAIVQHEGVLQTRFPPANRAKAASIADLKKCLFGAIQDKTVPRSKKQKQPSFLKRLSDFQLLVFLSRQMGFSKDFEEVCAVVQKRDGKSPALNKLKVVLENLCDRD